jgi:hypothetical protein
MEAPDIRRFYLSYWFRIQNLKLHNLFFIIVLYEIEFRELCVEFAGPNFLISPESLVSIIPCKNKHRKIIPISYEFRGCHGACNYKLLRALWFFSLNRC